MRDWMVLPFRRYLDFSGRSRRREFWSFQLLNLLIGVACLMLIFVGGSGTASGSIGQDAGGILASGAASRTYGPMAGVGAVIYGIWALASIIPSIAVTVRRLHDRNHSGWLYVAFLLVSWIPIVGLIAAIAFAVVLFMDGISGPNRYGEDPKSLSAAEVFA